MKFSIVMTATLSLLASSCCYSFVDRHHPVTAAGGDEVAVDSRPRLYGMLQHLWYVEQIASEQAQLAALRLQRKTMVSVRECKVIPVPSPVAQQMAGTLSNQGMN